MKKMNKLERIKSQFYWKDDEMELPSDSPNLNHYGVYRGGLTQEEILDYIRARANKLNVAKLYKKFVEIAGVNTMCVAPDGRGLMYRWDVQRYADVLFRKTRKCDLVWD